MLNYNRNKLILAGSFVLALLLSFSFNSYSAQSEALNVKSTVSIGIISFEALIPGEGLESAVICPLCTSPAVAGKIQEGAEKIVEDIFVNKLRDFKEVRILPSERLQLAYKRVGAESLRKPLLDVLKKVGEETGADILAVGYIYRYTERVGYDYSVKQPASVAYEIYMVNPSDKSIIWRGIFDKTQKSLMEDLFQISSFFRGGGKWLTAEQLSKQGMDEIFKKFPGFAR
ncbi:MAG: hypothetical protein JW914_07455 [Syntrophaceae bacterium]|nr:hypothetical protein [Syntrophaceae bacterium]